MSRLFKDTIVRTLFIPSLDHVSDDALGALVHARENCEKVGLFCGRTWQTLAGREGRIQLNYVVWEHRGTFDLVQVVEYIKKVSDYEKEREAETEEKPPFGMLPIVNPDDFPFACCCGEKFKTAVAALNCTTCRKSLSLDDYHRRYVLDGDGKVVQFDRDGEAIPN